MINYKFKSAIRASVKALERSGTKKTLPILWKWVQVNKSINR